MSDRPRPLRTVAGLVKSPEQPAGCRSLTDDVVSESHGEESSTSASSAVPVPPIFPSLSLPSPAPVGPPQAQLPPLATRSSSRQPAGQRLPQGSSTCCRRPRRPSLALCHPLSSPGRGPGHPAPGQVAPEQQAPPPGVPHMPPLAAAATSLPLPPAFLSGLGTGSLPCTRAGRPGAAAGRAATAAPVPGVLRMPPPAAAASHLPLPPAFLSATHPDRPPQSSSRHLIRRLQPTQPSPSAACFPLRPWTGSPPAPGQAALDQQLPAGRAAPAPRGPPHAAASRHGLSSPSAARFPLRAGDWVPPSARAGRPGAAAASRQGSHRPQGSPTCRRQPLRPLLSLSFLLSSPGQGRIRPPPPGEAALEQQPPAGRAAATLGGPPHAAAGPERRHVR
ncbi:basic salivary proline-rich protein 1-like [Sphaerodactylus townsendi]|uniref:basic salivary proline-rich protein 1-like n=1 Tax=Sphaerodactylus townsendi TaxID=933632 RepID=UPI002025BC24|nr:basic salivary proline-rich protein 1-like [Sphaerodactylus townsendi]